MRGTSSTHPWWTHHPCWGQIFQCGCFEVTHAPGYNPSPSALQLTLIKSLVLQSEPLWKLCPANHWDYRRKEADVAYVSLWEGNLATVYD